MTPEQVLVRARDILSEWGWCQGSTRDTRGGVCAIASIEHVTTTDGGEARLLLGRAIGGGSIIVWNDVPGRTFEEVLEAFDRAIVLAGEAHHE